MKATQRETLRRKIERTIKSLNEVSEAIYTTNLSNSRLHCLEIDASRLADYCKFVREQRINNDQEEALYEKH